MSWDKNTIDSSKTKELLRLIPGAKLLKEVELPGYGLNDNTSYLCDASVDGKHKLRAILLPNRELHQDVFVRTHDCDSDDVIETWIISQRKEPLERWEIYVDCHEYDGDHSGCR